MSKYFFCFPEYKLMEIYPVLMTLVSFVIVLIFYYKLFDGSRVEGEVGKDLLRGLVEGVLVVGLVEG